MAKFSYVEWLVLWLIETISFQFDWDTANSTKSLVKHGVTAKEVEDVFYFGAAVAVGLQVSPKVSEERLAIIGPTKQKRLLMIAFTLRDGNVRPISSRAANKKEKRLYETLRKITERL
jgi:uncharacterized DUF497 family protein